MYLKNILLPLMKSKLRFSVISMVLLIISLLIFSFLSSAFYAINMSSKAFEQKIGNINIYKLDDNFVGEVEENFKNQDNNVDILKQFEKELKSQQGMDYCNLTTQTTTIEKDFGKDLYTTRSNPDMKMKYSVLQVSTNFFEHYQAPLIEGNYFTDEDGFYEQGNTIPLIFGYDFKDKVTIGEEIPVKYGHIEAMGKVVGIMDKDSYYIRFIDEYLNDYIIMPAIHFKNAPETAKEKSFQRMVYYDNTDGVIFSELSASDVQNKINKICDSLGISDMYSIEGATNVRYLGIETNTIVTIFCIISLVLLLISIVCASLNKYAKTNMMMRIYSIHYLCGGSKKGIAFCVFIDSLATTFVSILPSLILCCYFFSVFYALQFGLPLWIIISIIISIPSIISVSSMKPANYLRGKD